MSNLGRDLQEAAHRVGEKIEEGYHTVKEATVGDSRIKNSAKETVHSTSNRIDETLNRAKDSINESAASAEHQSNAAYDRERARELNDRADREERKA